MIKLISKTLCNYYGECPDEYYLKFIHHNIDIIEDIPEEYIKIEQDLQKIHNFDTNSFLLYFSDVDNYSKFINNVDFKYYDKIYLRIHKIDEFDKLRKINSNNNTKIIVDIKDIETLDIKDFDIVIQIDKVNELPISKLNKLLNTYSIKEILLGQIPYISKEYDYLYDVMSKMYNMDSTNKLQLEKINKITNDIYSKDEYIEIVNKLQKIIESLKIDNEIDGVYKIFDYIAHIINYEDNGVIETKITNQNLIGPVLNNTGVCEGFSKYLQQMLSLINVNSIAVQGGGRKAEGGHVWNQVFINNKWYNADVTAASYAIKHNEEVKTFLVKDSKLLYKTHTSISYECNEDFEGVDPNE